jgi:hypothetical protein
MRVRGTVFATATALAVAACGSTHSTHTTVTPAPIEWRYVAGPSAGPQSPSYGLEVLTATGPSDIWAFGDTWGGPSKGSDGSTNQLGLRYDGNAWSQVPLPKGAKDATQLTLATALSSHDVWAAGSDANKILVQHFDGSGWTATHPLGSGTANALAADSPTDVWMAGVLNPGLVCGNGSCVDSASRDRPFIARFDGQTWVRTGGLLDTDVHVNITSLAVHGPADVWAAGSRQVQPHNPNGEQPLLAHWNGRTWTEVAVPAPKPTVGRLASVISDGHGGLWALGSRGEHVPGKNIVPSPYALHFNGTGWSTVSTAGLNAALGQAVPDGSGGLWAIDDPAQGSSARLHHFGSGRWSTVTPQGIPSQTTWSAIVSAGGRLWVAGTTQSGDVAFATPA